jgi:hypothetical protein
MDEWVKIEYNLNDIKTFDNLDELLKFILILNEVNFYITFITCYY